MSTGIEATTRGRILSASLIRGRRTRSMSLVNNIFIPMLQWSCCGLRSNAASTHGSAALMHERITVPLGMTSTALPLPRDLLGRAVQGYGQMGKPVGRPGEEGGTFQWLGSGQIYSSSRDMATFLAANLGELPGHGPIENAMAFAHQGVFTVSPRLTIGLAWQIVSAGNFTIIDKNGGLNNTSTYIGFAPQKKLSVV